MQRKVLVDVIFHLPFLLLFSAYSLPFVIIFSPSPKNILQRIITYGVDLQQTAITFWTLKPVTSNRLPVCQTFSIHFPFEKSNCAHQNDHKCYIIYQQQNIRIVPSISTWCRAIHSSTTSPIPPKKKEKSEQMLELSKSESSVGFDKNFSDFCNCFKCASGDFFFSSVVYRLFCPFCPSFFSFISRGSSLYVICMCLMNVNSKENSNLSKSWMWSLIFDNYVFNSYKVMHIF